MMRITNLLTICICLAFFSPAAAQETAEIVMDSGRLFDNSGNIDWLFALQDPEITEPLEMTKEQASALWSIMSKAFLEKARLHKDSYALGIEEGRKERAKIDQQFSLNFPSEYSKVLLPHQVEMINKTLVQMAISKHQMHELVGLLSHANGQVTKQQLSKLKEKLKKIQKEAEEKVSEIRQDGWAELLSKLNKKQKNSLRRKLEIELGN